MTDRGAWVRRALVAVLLVAAFVVAARALDGRPAAATATSDAPVVGTPLWSARRLPEPARTLAASAALQRDLEAGLAGNDGCALVVAPSGPVAAVRADQPLTPASTEKLLTAAAALAQLGPGFRYETTVVAPDPVADGTVERLWLVGDGDPTLATADFVAWNEARPHRAGNTWTSLEALADAVVATGVRSVPGGVLGDDTHYDDARTVPTWKPSYHADGEAGALGALVVNGGFADYEARRPADDPAVAAAARFTELLAQRGVAVGEPGRGIAATEGVVIATVASAPLPVVLGEVLRASDNTAAELVAKEVAVAEGGPPSTARATELIPEALRAIGVDTDGVTVADGSGLDRANRATCQALVDAIEAGERPGLAGLLEGLAVAGRSGTLAESFRGTPLDGVLKGKTGTLQGVTGLAGLLDGPVRVQFAVLVNGSFSEGTGVAIREDLVQRIARYPQAPPADQLVPAPAAPTE